MKSICKSLLFLLLILTIFACTERPLPVEKVITILNSEWQKTNKLNMLDTLYVELAGLEPGTLHTIEALDPTGALISKTTLLADSDGYISAAPLWYDVGLKDEGNIPDIGGELSLRAFHIHVTGPGTDYTEPFYFIYSENNTGKQPKPVVWSCNAAGELINAFDETGTPNGQTTVYVTARNIPAQIGGVSVDSIDVYIMPSRLPGEFWETGDVLNGNQVLKVEGLTLSNDAVGSQTLAPSAVWDLNGTVQMVNPAENNCAFSIILDINRNGLFDAGEDVNNDGYTDRFIDGVDGQGIPGFIVKNTGINDQYYTIKNSSGNVTNAYLSNSADTLSITLKNLTPGTHPKIKLFETGTSTQVGSDIVTTAAIDGSGPLWAVTNQSLFSQQAFTVKGLDMLIDYGGDGYYTDGVDEFLVMGVVIIPAQATFAITDGITNKTAFDETGTPSGSTSIHLNATGTGLPDGAKDLYILPHRGNWLADTLLDDWVVKTAVTVASGNVVQALIWDLNAGPKVINPSGNNNLYDVVLDAGGNGYYDSGTDTVLSTAFSILNTTANALPDVFYLNIASGGNYTPVHGGGSSWRFSDYDYRDVFAADGHDTMFGHGYNATRSIGIKATWIPYINLSTQGTAIEDGPSLYKGLYVDLYIVDATVAVLAANADLGSGTLADVAGGVKTLPIQHSCHNGYNQQTIWVPPFTEGSYYVIVDVNRDGKITEGVDIIDAVAQDGTTIKEDQRIVGFRVE